MSKEQEEILDALIERGQDGIFELADEHGFCSAERIEEDNSLEQTEKRARNWLYRTIKVLGK